MEKMGIAAQVYSVREAAEKDFAGTMKALRECGYEGVELAGLYGLSPETVRDCLAEAGLIGISAHVGLEPFQEDMEGMVKAYETIGCKYIGIPGMPMECHYGGARFQETCRFIEKLAACCEAHGIVLMYHNHDFEFGKTDKGTYFLDELFGAVDARWLQTEQDTCWVNVGGVDPVAYLEKYKGRCPVVHMKDFRRNGGEVEQYALGEGEQDNAAIVRKAEECGTKWLVVEQDDHPYGEPMENMAKSAAYLKGILDA